jgi:hypothetical protein
MPDVNGVKGTEEQTSIFQSEVVLVVKQYNFWLLITGNQPLIFSVQVKYYYSVLNAERIINAVKMILTSAESQAYR